MSASTSHLIRGVLRRDEGRIRRLLSEVADPADFAAELVQESLYHGVLPLVVFGLQSTAPESEVTARAAAELPARLAHVLRLESMAVEMVALLTQAGIECVLFKGAALSCGYYEASNERLYGDVDLLVSPSDFVRAGDLLVSAGLRRHGESLEVLLERGYGEAAFGNSHSQAIDLHWHLMREKAVRSAFDLRTADLLQRQTKVRVNGQDVPTLAPADQLLAVASHACFDGAYRLGWLLDLQRIVDSGRVDWPMLREYADRTGTRLVVQVMLDRARRAIGLITGEQLLHYSVWRALLASIEQTRPVARSFRQVGRGGVVFRSTRTSTATSAKALVELALSEALVPVMTDPRHRWRRPRVSRL